MNEDSIVVHAFINATLKMGKGKIVGQVCHAIHYITKKLETMRLQSKCPQICARYEEWERDGYKIKLHEIPSDELIELEDYEETAVVIDAGRTQIAPGSMTVIGFYPNTLKNAQSDTDNSNGDVVINNTIKNCQFEGDDEPCAMYIFINKDLKLSTENMVCEAGRVTSYVIKSLEQMKAQFEECPIICKKYQKWETEGCAKIVLKATTEQLEQLKLVSGSLYTTWKDTNVITTVAFYPNIKSETRQYTTGFGLL